jgi:hypothetical protein
MELYIENRSIRFIKRAYKRVTENTKATVYRVVIFNRGAFFKSAAFRFFKKKGIYDIEYVLFGTAALRRAITYLNRQNNKISLTVFIDKSLTKKDKEKLALVVEYENVLGEFSTVEIPVTAFETVSENYYKVVFDGLNATDFRSICTAKVTEDGQSVSNYMSYSVETYAYNRVQDETKPELAALMVAMMKYGDSTAAYFAK